MPISAVPLSVMGHAGSPGTDAVAAAFHATVDPDKVPLAVPATFKPPAHVALNVPLAVLPVSCVTFHLKSVQALAVEARLDEVQLPTNAAPPVVEGPSVLVRSWLQPDRALDATRQRASDRFFIMAYLDYAGCAERIGHAAARAGFLSRRSSQGGG